MALEQLSLAAPAVVDGEWDVDGNSNGRQAGGDEGSKTARLPRWTRHEILILIQGKRVAESRVRRRGSLDIGTMAAVQVEPKWAAVSSYCIKNGVNRGAVQCRKRWSNLAGDFKKIKEYESQIKEETESFWLMRNDFRRERKLPGFFDKEVYDILAGGDVGLSLGLAPSTVTNDDGLFSDFEHSVGGGGGDKNIHIPGDKEAGPSSIPAPIPISFGTCIDIGNIEKEGKKRKRNDDSDTELFSVLERNGNLVGSQLEAHNTNYKLAREEQNNHMNTLISVLDKVADALGRIADKL